MSPASLLLLAARRSVRPRTFQPLQAISQSRPLSCTSFLSYPKKGAEDRNTIDTESTEHTKSSTDAEAAQQDEAAYDPSKTSPESEMESAQSDKKGGGNPLEVSGANKDVSKQSGPEKDGGSEESPKEGSRSGPGSPKKGGTTS